MDKATALIEKMESSPNIKPAQATYNTYLYCACKTNNFEQAQKIFKTMKSKDSFTYTIFNCYLLKKGNSLDLGLTQKALEYYEEFKKSAN